MAFYKLKPQGPGNIWSYSNVDERATIRKMVFAYDFWSSEPIFKDVQYVFARRSVAQVLLESGFTGFSAQDVSTIKSAEYNPTSELAEPAPREPESVAWLKITGQPGRDDFGLKHNVDLIVSERALALLRAHGLKLCVVKDYDPNWVPEPMPESPEEQQAWWERRNEETEALMTEYNQLVAKVEAEGGTIGKTNAR